MSCSTWGSCFVPARDERVSPEKSMWRSNCTSSVSVRRTCSGPVATTDSLNVAVRPSNSIRLFQSTCITPGVASLLPSGSCSMGRSMRPAPSTHRRSVPRLIFMLLPVNPNPRASKWAGRPSTVAVAFGPWALVICSRSPLIKRGLSFGLAVCVSTKRTPSSTFSSDSLASSPSSKITRA